MNKIPYKTRVIIGVSLFLWSIACIIATIVFSQQNLGLWVLILGLTMSVLSFVLSILFIPKTNADDSVTAEKKNIKFKKQSRNMPRKHKKPFIDDKEWEELDEEDEECMYISEDK